MNQRDVDCFVFLTLYSFCCRFDRIAMRALFLVAFIVLITFSSAQSPLDVKDVLADSISFQEELMFWETHSAEDPTYYFNRGKKLLDENTKLYPVLHVELLRQMVAAGTMAKKYDELVSLLKECEEDPVSHTEYYAIQLLEGVVESAFHRIKLSDLIEVMSYCDSLPTEPYHYDLIRRSFYRAYTRTLEKESLFDEAATVAHSSLLLNLPEPYSSSAYYDEYLLGRSFFKVDNFPSASTKFRRVVELIPENPTMPARNIRARSLHYVGICAEKFGDDETYIRFTIEAVDSMLAMHTIDAIPPMLDVVNHLIHNGNYKEADRYFEQVDSVFKIYPPTDYINAGILISRYRYAWKLGQLEEAISLAQEAEVFAQKTIILEGIVTDLIEMLVEKGDYKKAYEYQVNYLQMLTEKRDVKSFREIEQRRHRYELKRQEDEKKLLIIQQQQQQDVIAMQDQLLFAAISAILFLLITAFYIAYVSKKLKRANNCLQLQAEELREAKNTAEKAAQAKADFLSVMSHEIRTPLNAIIGLNKELAEKDPREDQKANLNYVDQASKHLLELINDILDHNKLDAQKIKIEKKPVVLSELMDQLVKMTNILKGEKQIKVLSFIDQKLPTVILADPLRLRQIGTNLCMNAVKFTQKGTVTLRFSQKENGQLELEVTDTGIGIEHNAIEKIFKDFTQAHKNTARLYGGTGLGLSITKRLISLMGGEIKVVSKVNEGSSFFVTLPLETGNKTHKEVAELEPFKEGVRVLVAEDNELNKLVVKSVLSRWNLEFEIVSNGQECLDLLEKEQFDLVLMDVQMPVMDGLEATRRIRNNQSEHISKIPVIALTASSQPEEIAQMKEAGMDVHILKPIETNFLKKVMLQLLTT